MSARILTDLSEIRVGDVVRCSITTGRRKVIHEFTVDRIDGSYVEQVDGGNATLSIYFFGDEKLWELIERQAPPLPTDVNSAIQILELGRADEYSAPNLPVLAFRVDGSSSPWITGDGEDYLWIDSADILDWRPMKVVQA